MFYFFSLSLSYIYTTLKRPYIQIEKMKNNISQFVRIQLVSVIDDREASFILFLKLKDSIHLVFLRNMKLDMTRRNKENQRP